MPRRIKLFFFISIILILYGNAFAIVEEAKTHLDKPYVYAATGPNSFDCSGFTYYCVKKVYDIELKRNAYDQGYDETYEKIDNIDDLQEGDLVYFNTNLYDKDFCDHAGIYIGEYQFIHASSGKGKVIISQLGEGYYNERFSWGRRLNIIQEEEKNETV